MMTQDQAMAWLRAIANNTEIPAGVDWHESAAVLLELIEKFVPRSPEVQEFLRGELGSTVPGSR